MDWFRLSNLSIGSLTTAILLGVITVYLLTLKGKSPDTWYLAGYIAALFLLLLSYMARYSIFAFAGCATAQFSNLMVFGVVCLVQFAYHYGGNRHPRESIVALVLFSAVAASVWVSNFFKTSDPVLYDFEAQYFTYEHGPAVSFVTLAGYAWSFVVLLRNTVYRSVLEASEEGSAGRADSPGGGACSPSGTSGQRSALSHLIRPAGRLALSTRSFALLTLATAAVALLYLLFQTGVVARATYAFIFNTSSLLICLLIFIIYVNNAPQPVSFRTKLVGIPLATVMVTFGIVATSLTPLLNTALSARFQKDVELVRALLSGGDLQSLRGSGGEIAFVAPVSAESGKPTYYYPSVPEELRSRLVSVSGIAGMLQENAHEEKDPEPRFFYVDLRDTSSFFFYYRLTQGGTLYRIGFPYALYRLEVHRFWEKLAPITLATALFVVIGFPLAYKRGLLKPLGELYEAVRQVETGNYRLALSILSEDEVGRLARAYNRMVLALRNAEGNFKALAENANDAILLMSRSGTVIYANARASEISGYNPEELRKKHFRDLIHPDELHEVERRFSDRMNSGRNSSGRNSSGRINGMTTERCYETRFLDREGRTVPIEITGARTTWQDEPADVVVIRDISDRKRAEELLQAQQQQLLRADKLASLGALVAGMAHEVNNPNQVISMDARFLSDGLAGLFSLAETGEKAEESVRIAGLAYPDFKESAQSALSEISSSTARIGHIIQELKRFAGGEARFQAEPTDVNQVVRTVAELSRHLIGQATNRFTLALQDDLPRVKADRIGLEQVILNLLQNACQSLPDRNRGITVASDYDESARAVRIEIRDEGEGIPQEHLSRITEPFFTTRQENGGTGLGLSVSSRIVREHGGSLSFRSESGKGTMALVSLPSL
ncbi:MAG TPA: ATP-binding protein [Spirochaetia bacterium]|nr:ATP-binding protein [Spirochaetia bacterium]